MCVHRAVQTNQAVSQLTRSRDGAERVVFMVIQIVFLRVFFFVLIIY